MKTNIIYKACGMALAAAVCVGCADDPSLSDGVGPDASGAYVTLSISPGITPATRTVLPGQQNVHHVTRVALYAFKHQKSDNPLEAVCIGGMGFDEIKWEEQPDHDINGAVDGGTSTQTQRITLPERWCDPESETDKNAYYTFLAIGSDEVGRITRDADGNVVGVDFTDIVEYNSTNTYGLGSDRYLYGETLGECYAELQEGEANIDSIHASELFAGTLTVKGSQIYSGKVIDLNRRVAGVKGYFRRIPNEVGGTPVASLRVVYWNKQATAVPYYKRADTTTEDGKTVFNDYDNREESPVHDAQTSLIPAAGDKMEADDLDACTYFTIPRDQFYQNLPQTEADEDEEEAGDYYTAGSYVLPAPGATGDGNTTLYVVLVSEPDQDRKVTILQKRRVLFVTSYDTRAAQTRTPGVTDQGTGVIVGQEGNEESQQTERRYPIVANNYYTIGTAQEPIDMSTGETDVNIYVDPRWEGNNDLGGIIPKP